MTRDEAKARSEALGGHVAGSVSKKTCYVVLQQSRGRSNDLGVSAITEANFLKLLSLAKRLAVLPNLTVAHTARQDGEQACRYFHTIGC